MGRQRVQAQPPELLTEKNVRHWHQQPGAVARLVIGGDRSAVANTFQRREGCIDDVPACSPSGIDDEADSARVVLESGVVEAHASQLVADTLASARDACLMKAHERLARRSYEPYERQISSPPISSRWGT